MNVGHPIIGFDSAECRRAEILRQAEAARLVAEARHARPAAGSLRRRVGDALVRFGEHLQGARQRPITGELGDAAGALRLAR